MSNESNIPKRKSSKRKAECTFETQKKQVDMKIEIFRRKLKLQANFNNKSIILFTFIEIVANCADIDSKDSLSPNLYSSAQTSTAKSLWETSNWLTTKTVKNELTLQKQRNSSPKWGRTSSKKDFVSNKPNGSKMMNMRINFFGEHSCSFILSAHSNWAFWTKKWKNEKKKIKAIFFPN